MSLPSSHASLALKLLFMAFSGFSMLRAQDDDGAIPRPMRDDTFDTLMANPPFTRSLGISESLILTGVARFDKDTYATLMDTKTMESILVSQQPNRDGWQLVGVGGDPARMQTWSARIQIRGGEVVTIRYQKPPPRPPKSSSSGKSGGSSSGGGSSNLPAISDKQVSEAKAAAVNYKDGFLADGYPDKPPAEMVSKLSRLSTSQREDINRTMFGHRNQGLGLDARRQIYEGLVDRALQRR
ncbi:MAG: hypothetical protein U1F81_07720 [Verrucomicrobiaceae bacterium]